MVRRKIPLQFGDSSFSASQRKNLTNSGFNFCKRIKLILVGTFKIHYVKLVKLWRVFYEYNLSWQITYTYEYYIYDKYIIYNIVTCIYLLQNVAWHGIQVSVEKNFMEFYTTEWL